LAHMQFQRDRPVATPTRGHPGFAKTTVTVASIAPDTSPDAPVAGCESAPALTGTEGLARIAPDIAGQISAVWSDASATGLLIEQLIVGEDVHGLSHAVTSELLRLYDFNARCRVNDPPDTAWELPASRIQAPTPITAAEGNRS
jgi:hypothetical protein